MMEEPVSLLLKMHLMTGVASQNWNRGPALKNRLEGDASQYKRLLDRELLKDPKNGMNY